MRKGKKRLTKPFGVCIIYVDIECELETDMEKAIRSKLSNGTGNLVILVNFTALPATRAILKKLEGEN